MSKTYKTVESNEPEFELDAENDSLDDIPSKSEVKKMFDDVKED